MNPCKTPSIWWLLVVRVRCRVDLSPFVYFCYVPDNSEVGIVMIAEKVGPKCRLKKGKRSINKRRALFSKLMIKKHGMDNIGSTRNIHHQKTDRDWHGGRQEKQLTDRGTQGKTRLNTKRGNHRTRHSWVREAETQGQQVKTIRHRRKNTGRKTRDRAKRTAKQNPLPDTQN